MKPFLSPRWGAWQEIIENYSLHHPLFCFSYKSCLPTSHRHDIQKRNCVDRFRIRNTLKKFLKKVGNCSADECSLKLKYLTELASIEPSLGSETFNIDPSTSESGLIRVSGETGIQISGSSQNDGCSLVRIKTSVYFHLLVHLIDLTKHVQINCINLIDSQ